MFCAYYDVEASKDLYKEKYIAFNLATIAQHQLTSKDDGQPTDNQKLWPRFQQMMLLSDVIKI